MAAVAPIPYSPSTAHISQENRVCGGCHESVEIDSGGVVVAFGNSLWHVDCFKCAKCGDRVSADTNLLLLSDGSPVCSSCTYNCAVCKKSISDEAIMTGDESYHAACFTCKTCARHIGELVFAKTTQGIYCMACHNERVARSRRHQEQRRNRSKPRRDGHRDKERLQERPSYTQLRDNPSTTTDPLSPPNTPGLTLDIANADTAISYSAKRVSTQSLVATLQNSRDSAKRDALPPLPASPTAAHSLPSPTITATRAPPERSSSHDSSRTPRGDSLPLPKPPGPRRRSFDDGVRPLNGLLSPEAVSSLSRAPSSSRRKNGANKHSGPGVRLDFATDKALPYTEFRHSPTNLLPTGDAPDRQNSQLASRSRNSDERSPSPGSRGRQKSSGDDSFYSPLLSPSFLNGSQPPPPTENPNMRSKEPMATKEHTLQDQVLPPPSHHKPSSQQATSGRASPETPLNNVTINGVARESAQETPERGLPNLPDATIDGRRSYEDKQEEEIPLTLPPISFSESDVHFYDLLDLGGMQLTHPAETVEKSEESGTLAYTRVENEAGPSTTAPPSAAAPSPPKDQSSSLPSTKASSPVQPPLNNLPKRSASLARKFSSRKPVPKAIVLPESFQGNMTLDIDDSYAGVSSPMSTGYPETPRKLLSPGVNPARRPASAGTGAHAPSSPLSKVRRSSDNAQPGSPLATMTSPTRSSSNPVVTVTNTASTSTTRPVLGRPDMTELILRRVKEALNDAQESGASTVRLDREFLEMIHMTVQTGHERVQDIRGKFDRMRRTSQQFIEGLSVAQEEYDKEIAARRDAEAEVTRLKVQLSGQAARLTQLSAEDRKREVGEQMSRDMSANLDDLERDLSRIIAERDLAVAEVEELTASKMAANHGDGALQRSLSLRFDNLKTQYKRELEPLLRQREALLREINELKEQRNIYLEETTALNARNEELVALNAQTSRQIESGANAGAMRTWSSMPTSIATQQQLLHQQQGLSTPKMTPLPPLPAANVLYNSTTTLAGSQEERDEPKSTPNEKKLKWFKPSREPMKPINDAHAFPPEKGALGHNFQLLPVLRVARCDHCGEKMWGTQLRCSTCNLCCHNRCAVQTNVRCSSEPRPRDETGNLTPLQPSMFGRDLTEQVRADSMRGHRDVPIIVQKCIEAVEALAMDYEGVYRKTGGTSQSKVITQLFERGNYEAFDLSNPDIFNDVSSITSVLKTYFRQLPNPLLTNALHEAFVSAASIRDPRGKADSLSSLVYQLPSEHFHTLQYLMLHLHRIQMHSAENLMNARNLGVVFGPTLMRSSDPNREYADMAGKALAIEWLIENARSVFREDD